VIWGYASFALTLAACLRYTNALPAVIVHYRQAIPIFLTCASAAFVGTRLLGDAIVVFPWSSTPVPPFKAGDVGVHLGAVGVFLLLGLVPRAKTTLLQRVNGMVMAAAWLGAAGVVMSLNRGAMLALVTAFVVAACLYPRRIGLRLAATVAAAAVCLAIVMLATTGQEPPAASETERPVSLNQAIENMRSVLGSGSRHGNLDGTREWRLDWWREIVSYTFEGRYFFGKGFGVNLASDDGFQVNEEESLRSPHNIHMTVLARTGVPGLFLWVGLNVGFALMLLVGHVQARRAGQLRWAATCAWVLAYWAALIVNGSVDVYIEGPSGGIWYWAVIGAGIAVLDGARAERRGHVTPRALALNRMRTSR
jgi:hypothetical protein